MPHFSETPAAWARSMADTLEARVADREPLSLGEMRDLMMALRMLAQRITSCPTVILAMGPELRVIEGGARCPT